MQDLGYCETCPPSASVRVELPDGWQRMSEPQRYIWTRSVCEGCNRELKPLGCVPSMIPGFRWMTVPMEIAPRKKLTPAQRSDIARLGGKAKALARQTPANRPPKTRPQVRRHYAPASLDPRSRNRNTCARGAETRTIGPGCTAVSTVKTAVNPKPLRTLDCQWLSAPLSILTQISKKL